MTTPLEGKILDTLKNAGELSHSELCYRLGASPEEMQEALTTLRAEDEVKAGLNRKYSLIE
jgi:DNA-binding IclR family transcriptional regulator